jgi:four helix bundle protein
LHYLRVEPARSFRDVLAWRRAHDFVLAAYRLSGDFPRHETYGLSSQLRRAAVSIAANIAEGFRRRGRGDKIRFLNIAQASLEECRYYLLLAADLEYGDAATANRILEDASRLLNRYVTSIAAR